MFESGCENASTHMVQEHPTWHPAGRRQGRAGPMTLFRDEKDKLPPHRDDLQGLLRTPCRLIGCDSKFNHTSLLGSTCYMTEREARALDDGHSKDS